MKWSKEFRTALFSLSGVGNRTHYFLLKTLTKHEVTEAEFWANSGHIWSQIPITQKIEKSIQNFKKEYNQYSYVESLLQKKIRVSLPEEPDYPTLLKQIDFPPAVIFLKGAPLHTNSPLGVVGTRQVTAYGKQVIRTFVPEWVKQGKEIISGFMYGADVCAQQAALDAGGYTVGVLGFGFDWMYPRSQLKLMEEFLERGATFLSPFAPHVGPKPGNFPARNTIIAGICEGICVIEAGVPSGSLLTAQMAVEFSREVWAVPGSVFSRFSLGTQKLLEQGAQCLSHPRDIDRTLRKNDALNLELLSGSSAVLASDLLPQLRTLSPQQQTVLDVLQPQMATIETLVNATELSLSEVGEALSELQIKGLVEEKGVWWQAAT
jgi:DNA processing protein